MPQKFRFESLLKLRESAQLEKKDAFLAAQARLDAARNALREIEAVIASFQRESAEFRAAGRLSPRDLQRRGRYLERLTGKRDEALSDVQICEIETESKREELDEAIKDTKILEKLKERQETEFREEKRRRDDKEADEIAIRQKVFVAQKEKNDENQQ